MHALSGKTADDAWRAAAVLFRAGGPAQFQAGRGGDTRELLHVLIEIENPRARWVTSRTPAINPAFALVEVFWIAAGRKEVWLPAFWNPQLPRFCGHSPDISGAYGYRLRDHFGLDQLDRIYRALEAQPDSRQTVLQIWDARADLPDTQGRPARDEIPCNVIAIPKVRSGRLEWLQVLRSNDLFRGLPYNVVQFTVLQEMLAGWLGLEVGSYHHLSDSLHVYAADLAAVRSSGTPIPLAPSDESFALPRATWDSVLRDVMHRLEIMASSASTPERLRAVAFLEDTPEAYEQALRIAAADAARRRGWPDLAELCADGCKSVTLNRLWQRWTERVSHVGSGVQETPALLR
jgi:thymidylate synthase